MRGYYTDRCVHGELIVLAVREALDPPQTVLERAVVVVHFRPLARVHAVAEWRASVPARRCQLARFELCSTFLVI